MASGNGLGLNCLTGSPITSYFSAQAYRATRTIDSAKPILLVALSMGATKFCLALGVILLVYQVELNVLVPGVLGKEMRLHPVNILFFTPATAELFGLPVHSAEEGRDVLEVVLKAAESADGWQVCAAKNFQIREEKPQEHHFASA